jgi:hypothetical protein
MELTRQELDLVRQMRVVAQRVGVSVWDLTQKRFFDETGCTRLMISDAGGWKWLRLAAGSDEPGKVRASGMAAGNTIQRTSAEERRRLRAEAVDARIADEIARKAQRRAQAATRWEQRQKQGGAKAQSPRLRPIAGSGLLTEPDRAVEDVLSVARSLGVPAAQLTAQEYTRAGGRLTSSEITIAGGWKLLRARAVALLKGSERVKVAA